jgi:hypothetical protein
MKIKNLPREIKDRAMVYVREKYPDKKRRPSKLIDSFAWLETEEGFMYWELVDSGEFLEAEQLRTNNFDEEKKELQGRLNDHLIDAMDWFHSDTISSKPFFLDEVLSITVNEPEVVDPIVEAVREKLRQRSAVGIKKYGTTLDRDDYSLADWLNESQQEAMDMVLYFEAAICKIKKYGVKTT